MRVTDLSKGRQEIIIDSQESLDLSALAEMVDPEQVMDMCGQDEEGIEQSIRINIILDNLALL